MKVTIEEAADADEFRALVDGVPVTGIDVFCADPRPPRYEINFHLPDGIGPGARTLTMSLGRRALGSHRITVTKKA